jgi:hypothetical protein
MTRAEVENLVEKKLASVVSLANRLEGLIVQAETILARMVTIQAARDAEMSRALLELHQLSAAVHEHLGGKKS